MKNDFLEFVAVDFEYATSYKGSVCSVGIVTFRNGEIIDEYFTLIQPPNNDYDFINTRVTGITPNQTLNAKSFGDAYPEIRARVYGKTLVAHGAFHTDKHCLEQAMAYYKISDDLNIEWRCTQEIVNSTLVIACKECDIDLEHHQALSDAKACGYLFLAHLKGSIDLDRIAEARLNQSPSKKYEGLYPNKISGEVLKPDFENVSNKSNPFFKKKVVISGFNDDHKNKLASELKSLGADLDSGVGKNTNYLIIGDNPGPSKIQKMKLNIDKGKEAKIISYNEYQDIVKIN